MGWEGRLLSAKWPLGSSGGKGGCWEGVLGEPPCQAPVGKGWSREVVPGYWSLQWGCMGGRGRGLCAEAGSRAGQGRGEREGGCGMVHCCLWGDCFLLCPGRVCCGCDFQFLRERQGALPLSLPVSLLLSLSPFSYPFLLFSCSLFPAPFPCPDCCWGSCIWDCSCPRRGLFCFWISLVTRRYF